MTNKSDKDEEEDISLPPAPDFDSILESGEEKSDTIKVIEQLASEDDIEVNTEFTSEEIGAFQTLSTLADDYEGLEALDRWLKKGMRMRVSRGRRGRNETVRISARNPQMDNGPNKQNFFDKLRSW